MAVTPSMIVEFINSALPGVSATSIEYSNYNKANLLGNLTGLIALLDSLPSELAPAGSADAALLIRSRAAIQATVQIWTTKSDAAQHGLQRPPEGHPVAIIRDILSKCPDEAPTEDTTELEFIDDISFRESLRLDISGATKAFHNQEWKAATVLAGAAIEALLLWILEREEGTQQNKPNRKPLLNSTVSEYKIDAFKKKSSIAQQNEKLNWQQISETSFILAAKSVSP